ncbi:putative prolyl 4-hydroxylase [Lyophyllum shimeji]|uniref:Prolyl 4-hydroxylase n=1 Tax=Lyophyllum shimeji TaxID=47721 RepID=A0A9P3US73_LYOSH|nr:putative prolyl 4-hydroxylase [Lyophyllum shimeji]
MAKNSKKRKQLADNPPVASKKPRQDTKEPRIVEDSPPLIGNLIYQDELETTTEILTILAKNPTLIGLKALKPFKTAVHDYWRVANETTNTGCSLTSRISSALVDQRHVDALVLLSEMVIRAQVPKLGSLQRWVRECDAVLTPSMPQDDQNRVWQVLDAILRTTQPELIPSAEESGGILRPGTRLRWYEPFTVQPACGDHQKHSIDPNAVAEAAVQAMKVLQVTAGPDRRPPNKHAAIIYYSPLNSFALASVSDRTRQPRRHDLPGVPGAFIINDVFEIAECESLVKTAEKVGFLPDEPVAGSATQLSSVLAHNLIWLADKDFISVLYGRIVDHLPPIIHGGAVKGINARFRLYRYRPEALYRPHIDGAWPASALDEATSPPSYIYDSDPTVYSRLTLLIYLNDDFEGGCTTFFLPSSTQGVLDARPVKPRTGTVCVFPHGAAKGSLLHEGSGVTVGAKYVIRTEILYEVDKSERVDTATKD